MKQSPKKETANQLPTKPSTTEKGSESFGASRIAGTKPPGNCNCDMLEELGGKFQGGITNLTSESHFADMTSNIFTFSLVLSLSRWAKAGGRDFWLKALSHSPGKRGTKAFGEAHLLMQHQAWLQHLSTL